MKYGTVVLAMSICAATLLNGQLAAETSAKNDASSHTQLLDLLNKQEVKRVKELMQSRKSLADCPYRPLYHLSTPKGRMHDPGGIASWNGNYHLFYIGHGGKGHAVSDDLVHWQDLPGIPNIGGLTGQMLVRDGEALMSVTRDGSVNLASSRDALLLRWDCKPVLSLGEDLKGYQGPVDSCFWKEEDGTWSMLLRKHRWTMGAHFGGNLPTGALFRSENLEDWNYHGIFFEKTNAVEPGDDLACPNFLPIGQVRHILIWFCHPRGPMYTIGRYDEENGKFNAEHHGRFSNGPPLRGSLHAPSSFVAPDGRLVTVFNVTERNNNMGGWIGMMSLPRQLSLREGYGKRTENSEENKRDYFNPLRIEPVAELESLRHDPVSLTNIVTTPNQEVVLSEIEGAAMEIVAEIDPMKASELELRVLRSPGGEEYTTIRLYMEGAHGRSEYARTLSVDVSNSSRAPSARSRTPESGHVWMKDGDPLRLRVFIDRSIVEVFANETQCLTMRTYPSRKDSTGVSFYSRGSKAEIGSLAAYQMKSIWAELGVRG